MSAHDAETATHPGLMVGPTSEFSLFFRVKPGNGEYAVSTCATFSPVESEYKTP